MKKAISLFLVLSVLCSCALVDTVFAEGTTLPNNVQWGMSVQTIREITGETEHPGYYNDAETVLQLPVAGQRVSKYTATQLYVFCRDSLIAICDDWFSDNDAKDYAYLQGALTEKYGECVRIDADIVSDSFHNIGVQTDDHRFTECLEWVVGEDTRIMMYMLDDSMIQLLYVNTTFDPSLVEAYDTTGL